MNKKDFNHQWNDPERIFNSLPKETQEVSNFFFSIIEFASKNSSGDLQETGINCMNEGCGGTISSKILYEENAIKWQCSECETGGNITNWE